MPVEAMRFERVAEAATRDDFLPSHFIHRRNAAYAHHGLDWESLAGVDFRPDLSIIRLQGLLEAAQNAHASRSSVLEYWVEEVREDLRGFTQEYVDDVALTPVQYEGVRTEVAELFQLQAHSFRLAHKLKNSNIPNKFFNIRRMINDYERGGAVLRGWVNLEDIIATAQVGSFVILTSPDGETGIPEKPFYEDSRTYILQIVEDRQEDGIVHRVVKGYDVHSDFTKSEHVRLLNHFRSEENQLENTTSEADIVETPVLISDSKYTCVADVIRVMEEIRAESGSSAIFERKQFADVYTALENQDLWKLDPRFKILFEQFQEVVLHEYARVEVEIKQALALLVIESFAAEKATEFAAALARPFDTYKQSSYAFSLDTATPQVDPYEEYARIYQRGHQRAQQTGGSCPTKNGGDLLETPMDQVIREVSISEIPGTASSINALLSSDEKYFECPKCGTKIESGKGITQCPNPNCRLTKEEAGSLCD